jgi:hypothetical protein
MVRVPDEVGGNGMMTRGRCLLSLVYGGNVVGVSCSVALSCGRGDWCSGKVSSWINPSG